MNALLNIFFPEVCPSCHEHLNMGEKFICTTCRHALPRTDFHTLEETPIHNLLLGRVPLEYATALFYYHKKSDVQHLIHNLKYRNHESISYNLGAWLGEELKLSGRFADVDCVVPVPLHWIRRHFRGYNQVDGFAIEIAKALNIPVVKDVLYRRISTSKQVFMKRESRSTSILNSFAVRQKEKLMNKHILLVDDLITTGGTAEGCYLALQEISGLKVSMAFMAMAAS